jgi:hypothetical protein
MVEHIFDTYVLVSMLRVNRIYQLGDWSLLVTTTRNKIMYIRLKMISPSDKRNAQVGNPRLV